MNGELRTFRRRLERLLGAAVLLAIYGTAVALSRVLTRRRRPPRARTGNILVIGTFHNPNWFYAHVEPLARSVSGEVILVCDARIGELPGVRYVCPPDGVARLFSRALTKWVWALAAGLRYRPDLYMGYHVFPAAVSALTLARLLNRPACYQDTSGPLELEGGGWHAENRLLTSLNGPSRAVERMAFALVREFDSVVVRGSQAAQFIRGLGFAGRIATITGSIREPERPAAPAGRDIDVIFVGRLTEYKRPDRFLDVIARAHARLPELRAAVVGAGPDAELLQRQARALGLEDSVRFLGQRADTLDLLARAKVFVLTSRWEGISIAMIEAMAAGAVPVVSDVGDLRDLIRPGTNGYILAAEDREGFAAHIVHLLTDEGLWRACSAQAAKAAMERSGLGAVARQWREHFAELFSGPSLPGASGEPLEAKRRA